MTNNNYDSLQYVFACMSIHSLWVKIIKNDISQVSEYFNLSTNDLLILTDFLNHHSQQILASAVLLEEKRWREVLSSIKYSSILATPRKLKPHWKNYLETYGFKDNIPASPILESIAFLKYLLHKKFNDLYQSVFEYELFRNMTLAYEFEPTDATENINNNIVKENPESYQVIINLSFISKNFKCSISKIIKDFQKNLSAEKIRLSTNELVGFYKHKSTGMVKTIQLTEASHSAILKLSSATNVSTWVKNMLDTEKMKPASCFNFLEQLHLSGTISLIQINRC